MPEHAIKSAPLMEAQIDEAQLHQLEEAEEREFLSEIGYTEPDPAAPEDEREQEIAVRVDFLLEKRAEIEREIARNEDVARRRIQMIESWRDEENTVLGRQIEWLDRRITDHAAAFQLGENGNKKSRRLPHGQVGFRKTRDTVEIEDMELAVSFAEAHDLPIKKEVNKTPLIEFVQSTGEEPNPETDGFRFVPGEEPGQFYIKSTEG